jgi:hypothetical protein
VQTHDLPTVGEVGRLMDGESPATGST